MSKQESDNRLDAQATIAESQSGVPSTARNPLLVKQLLDIDVKDQLKEKMGMSYLEWSIAVKHLILIHPAATWKFLPHTVFPDSSIMVKTSVTINDVTKEYILPVYGSRGKAIPNPDAFQINTAYQRCLVKTIASFGLGLDVFTQDETDDLYTDYSEVKEQSKEPPKDSSKNKPLPIRRNYFSPAGTKDLKARKDFVSEMSELIKSCTDRDALVELWSANKELLDRTKREDFNDYEVLIAAGKKAKQNFKEE